LLNQEAGGREAVTATVNLPFNITTRQDEEHCSKDKEFILFASPAILLTMEENIGNSIISSPACLLLYSSA